MVQVSAFGHSAQQGHLQSAQSAGHSQQQVPVSAHWHASSHSHTQSTTQHSVAFGQSAGLLVVCCAHTNDATSNTSAAMISIFAVLIRHISFHFPIWYESDSETVQVRSCVFRVLSHAKRPRTWTSQVEETLSRRRPAARPGRGTEVIYVNRKTNYHVNLLRNLRCRMGECGNRYLIVKAGP